MKKEKNKKITKKSIKKVAKKEPKKKIKINNFMTISDAPSGGFMEEEVY